jgi:hypothetical protein
MCTPKVPEPEKVPIRAATVLPNNGDPTIRASDLNRRRVTPSAVAASVLGTPITSNPLGMTGNG